MSEEQNTDLVSVGMPVYNEEANLEAALTDILAQTHSNLEIIVSDNASTDGTSEIAREFASSDSRIVYVRHDRNLGPHANFKYALEQSSGAWFMWAAGDDRWAPEFIERNLDRLKSDGSLVCSISRVRWTGPSGGEAKGTSPIHTSVSESIELYLRTARDNSRFYGLFRRAVLLEAFPDEGFYSADLATMIGTLLRGAHAEIPEVLMVRRRRDPNDYVEGVDEWNRAGIDRWFPLLPMTRHVLRKGRIPMNTRIMVLLFGRNVYEHLRYFSRRPTPYGRFCKGLLRVTPILKARVTGDSGSRID